MKDYLGNKREIKICDKNSYDIIGVNKYWDIELIKDPVSQYGGPRVWLVNCEQPILRDVEYGISFYYFLGSTTYSEFSKEDLFNKQKVKELILDHLFKLAHYIDSETYDNHIYASNFKEALKIVPNKFLEQNSEFYNEILNRLNEEVAKELQGYTHSPFNLSRIKTDALLCQQCVHELKNKPKKLITSILNTSSREESINNILNEIKLIGRK